MCGSRGEGYRSAVVLAKLSVWGTECVWREGKIVGRGTKWCSSGGVGVCWWRLHDDCGEVRGEGGEGCEVQGDEQWQAYCREGEALDQLLEGFHAPAVPAYNADGDDDAIPLEEEEESDAEDIDTEMEEEEVDAGDIDGSGDDNAGDVMEDDWELV